MKPAALTTTSTPPNSAATVEQSGEKGLVGDVGADRDGACRPAATMW